MSDPVIELRDINKQYRLFKSKGWRLLDALGIPVPREAAWDFWALRNVSLSIQRGERVGLIGRNGAGKSTLLKLIAGLIRETSGSVRISGRVTALMELGTGFHPDLTGLQNLRASLAYLGVTGRSAKKKIDEVLEFAELGDFIDHPFRVYSAGMQARLTFTVATSVEPEILIVDEILGAGDAYFAMKAATRMRDLTRAGATLLLVSHDLASVQMMCDRCIWVDRGRIAGVGDTLTISKSYMGAVRRQEDMRLRLSESQVGASPRIDPTSAVTGRFVVGEPTAPRRSHRIRSLTLKLEGQTFSTVHLGDARDNDPSEDLYLIDIPGFTNWSAAKEGGVGISVWREFRDEGGRYFHAPFAIKVDLSCYSNVEIEIVHQAAVGEEVRLEFAVGDKYYSSGALTPSDGDAWRTESFALPAELLGAAKGEPALAEDTDDHIVAGDSYGDSSAEITSTEFRDPDDAVGGARRTFICGEALEIQIKWNAAIAIDHCRLVTAFYRIDGRCAAQIVSPVTARLAGEHHDQAILRPLRLGPGEYIVSVGIFRDLHDTHRHGVNPIHVLDRRFRLKVIAPPHQATETGEFLHDVDWQVFS